MFFKSKYISEKKYKKNLELQIRMSPQTVEQLYKHGISSDKKLKLEYFFYTNSTQKANSLSEKLIELGYESKFEDSAHNSRKKIITGWTSPICIKKEDVLNWTRDMCEIGYSFDCEFDGWGTNIDQ